MSENGHKLFSIRHIHLDPVGMTGFMTEVVVLVRVVH
jgi:hypothetical protein